MKKFQLLIYLLFPFITFIFFTSDGLWKSSKAISHDVIFYYEYLPAIFIEKDLTFKYTDKDPEFYKEKVMLIQFKDSRIPKMSSGLAMLYLPYFSLAYLFCFISNIDICMGYAKPFHYAIAISGLIHCMIGLFFLRKILLRYFSEKITLLTLISIFFGTNLFFYTFKEGGMSHQHSFMLSTIFLYYLPLWHQNKSIIYDLLLGLILGLMILIRPTNILFLIILIGYNFNSFKNQFLFLMSRKRDLIIIGIGIFIIWVPQLLFWKYSTNQFFFYSYSNEQFFFNDPKIFESLFGFRKGLIIYSPIMIFSLIGLFFYLKNKEWGFSIFIFILIQFYVITSWWCWWYGGSFSYRPYIDLFAVLSMPLAYFFHLIFQSQVKWRIIMYSLIIFTFISLNQLHTYQFGKTLIHYDSMTFEAYRHIFIQTKKPENYELLLNEPNYEKALNGDR